MITVNNYHDITHIPSEDIDGLYDTLATMTLKVALGEFSIRPIKFIGDEFIAYSMAVRENEYALLAGLQRPLIVSCCTMLFSISKHVEMNIVPESHPDVLMFMIEHEDIEDKHFPDYVLAVADVYFRSKAGGSLRAMLGRAPD